MSEAGMRVTDREEELERFCSRIQECIAPYAGRIDYGNLRSRVSRWDCGEEEPVTNIALVYETPGGSTDQINVTYHHHSGAFGIIDAEHGEVLLDTVGDVMDRILPRITGIPQRRRDALCAEVRRQIDDGRSTAGLFGHLNRVMQSEFKGGTITHIELRDAMTFAARYMKERRADLLGP
jgi:hypothetical protein